jgi:hypothetical protein
MKRERRECGSGMEIFVSLKIHRQILIILKVFFSLTGSSRKDGTFIPMIL